MTIMGFNYDNVITSEVPITFTFDKEHNQVIAYFVVLCDIFVVREEITIHENQSVLFAYRNGMVAGFIEKIDYEKQRIKVGKFYISEKDEINIIGIDFARKREEEE